MTPRIFWSGIILAVLAGGLWLSDLIGGAAVLALLALIWSGMIEFGLEALGRDTRRSLEAVDRNTLRLIERLEALERREGPTDASAVIEKPAP